MISDQGIKEKTHVSCSGISSSSTVKQKGTFIYACVLCILVLVGYVQSTLF